VIKVIKGDHDFAMITLTATSRADCRDAQIGFVWPTVSEPFRFGAPLVPEAGRSNIAHESMGRTLLTKATPHWRRSRRAAFFPGRDFRHSPFRTIIVDLQSRFNRVSSSDQNFSASCVRERGARFNDGNRDVFWSRHGVRPSHRHPAPVAQGCPMRQAVAGLASARAYLGNADNISL
jgi:hypothetical protein